jgi:dTDP-4-dehydrorhamnose reductase
MRLTRIDAASRQYAADTSESAEGKQNFPWKLPRWADDGRALRVVDDQVSISTSTPEIVRLSLSHR